MNTGLFILSIFLTISLSQARTKKDRNVFNFEIPQWARKEVDKTSFSGLVNKVNKMMTNYHLAGKSNSYPDIIHLLVN
jgi:tRNA A37 threonylcarbamoyltransferase TsaD